MNYNRSEELANCIRLANSESRIIVMWQTPDRMWRSCTYENFIVVSDTHEDTIASIRYILPNGEVTRLS